MGSIFGQNFKISVFGESHGPAIGVVIDGLPSGFTVDFDNISEEMIRRNPDPCHIQQRETSPIMLRS